MSDTRTDKSPAHILPLRREDLPQFEPLFKEFEGWMGYVPNTLFTLGRRPEMLGAFVPFFFSVMGPGQVDMGLKAMVAQLTGQTVGCPYCESHAAEVAHNIGVETQKVASVCRYQVDDRFTEAERAALSLAEAAATHPNAATRAHFDALAEHFSQEQIVELVAVMALFGFLTRWNDTCATELEDKAFTFGTQNLTARGWNASAIRPA